jgi:hypothetical protein
MSETALPWGVNRLRNIIAPRRSGIMAGLPDGRWVLAVSEPYDTLGSRLRGAWWVLTGRAHAIVWPKPGELEDILSDRHELERILNDEV